MSVNEETKPEDRVGNVLPPLRGGRTPAPLVPRFAFAPAQGYAPRPQHQPAAAELTMSNSEQRILTTGLRLRCSPDDEAAIREKARDAGATVSAFLRAAALGRKTRSTTDSQTINELRRLGGMLKDQFNKSGGQYSAESAATLQQITSAISRIAHDGELIK